MAGDNLALEQYGIVHAEFHRPNDLRLLNNPRLQFIESMAEELQWSNP